MAVALFLAVCAYGGAKLYGGLQPGMETVTARRVTVTDTVTLQGIAVRREQLVFAPGAELRAVSGERLPAGAVLAVPANGEMLRTSGSAVFFSQTDGYESLSPDGLDRLSVSELRALLASEPADPEGAAGRLVCESAWYFLALAEMESTALRPGACRIQFDGFERSIRARIISVRPNGQGEAALLLRLTAGGSDLLSLRKTGAALILAEYSGFALPQEAVLSGDDGADYVLILTLDGCERRRVEILFQEEGRCIAAISAGSDALQEGELVIANAKIYTEREII